VDEDNCYSVPVKRVTISPTRTGLVRRKEQAEFVRRGLAAIQRTQAAGDGVLADAVIARLEAKLAAARKARRI